jgi:uncharacterized protein (DUF342 family)
MDQTPTGDDLRVEITQDRSAAILRLSQGERPEGITPDACAEALAGAGVDVDDAVRASVAELLAELRPGTPLSGVVARGTPAVNGRHGYIDWLVAPPSDTPDAPVCVEAGQEIGRVVPPTGGEPGIDVLGTPVPPEPGRPFNPVFDDSVRLRSDGALVATIDGVLSRSLNRVAVKELLDIDASVDNATGNISFTGDVYIRREIRDRFHVHAGGNVTVLGMVEAAEIVCEGDLLARGGMAGRNRGRATVHGDCQARFFDAVSLEVFGVLDVEREIINCSVVTHSGVRAPSAAFIGGSLVTGGPVEIAKLGSPAGVATRVEVGRAPLVEPRRAELEDMIRAAQEQRDAVERDLRSLTETQRERDDDGVARRTELTNKLAGIDERIERCRAALERVQDRVRTAKRVDLLVRRAIHARTCFVFGDKTYTVSRNLPGPVRIRCDAQGELVFRTGSAGVSTPLASVCDLQIAA